MSEQEEGPPGFTGGTLKKREKERKKERSSAGKERKVNGRIRCRIRSVFKRCPHEKRVVMHVISRDAMSGFKKETAFMEDVYVD